jgi:hypothetical protein
MATELVKHANPAEQHKISASPTPEIDIEVRHPYIPWRFNNFFYERNFLAGNTTITLYKRMNFGAVEGEIATLTLGPGQSTAFFDRTVELGHGDSIRVVSSGDGPVAGSDLHSISVVWEEKRGAG